MRCLLLVLVLLATPLCAEELVVEDFVALIQHLQASMTDRANYQLSPGSDGLVHRIAEVTRVKAGDRLFVTDLRWVADVGDAIVGESSKTRRRLLFVNLVDTLNGLLLEFVATHVEHAVSRQEMNEALERALNRTSVIKFSEDAVFDSSLEWCGRGGFVADQPGEVLNLVSARPLGDAGVLGGSTQTVARPGHSGGSSGYSGSNISAAGSSLGGVSDSGASARVSSGGGSSGVISHSASQVRVPVQSQHVPAVAPVSAVQSTAEPQRAKLALPPPPPPPKPSVTFRPPPPTIKVPDVANSMFWVMMFVAVIGFIVIIFLIIKNMRSKIVREQERVELVERHLSPERMRNETIYENALREAEQGNYSEAIRLLTIGALLLLEARRVISYQDSFTNGEYLRELLVEQQLHSMFATPLALFDRLIYGFQSPDQKDFEVFKAFYLDLERLKR
ncbi:MAG: hypothetical protein KKB51_24610 [Candidatus Riflebacteria bacterium]|nr:hypothetical protein [Candidatus Riflebacteria bacterium]